MFSSARNFEIRDSVFNAYVDPGTARSLSRACIVDSTMAENEVYARLLFRKQRGYALWKPKPDERLPETYKQEGIRIGDVGALNEFGGFDYLFNTCLPANHPINAGRVPPDFKQLHVDESDTKGSTREYPPGSHVVNNTSEVHRSRVPYSEEYGPISGVPEQVGAGLSFSSSASEGALLVLPEGGMRMDHQQYLNFFEHAAACAQTWYEFVNGPLARGVPNGALYLITGFDKARAWGVASFAEAQPGSVYLDFVPKQSDNVIGAPEYHFSRCDFASSSSDADDIYGNQSGCIFLRGFKIAVRTSRAFPRVKIASEVTDISGLDIDQLLTNQRTGNPSSASSTTRRPWQRFWQPKRSEANQEHEVLADFFESLLQVEDLVEDPVEEPVEESVVEELPLPAKFQVFHPSNVLNQWILDNTNDEVAVAITHDSDWASLIFENPNDDFDDPAKLDRYLRQQLKVAEFDYDSFYAMFNFPATSVEARDDMDTGSDSDDDIGEQEWIVRRTLPSNPGKDDISGPPSPSSFSGEAPAIFDVDNHSPISGSLSTSPLYPGGSSSSGVLLEEFASVRGVWDELTEKTSSYKGFKVGVLSRDTFLTPAGVDESEGGSDGTVGMSWKTERAFTGRVTCSILFSTVQGRALVAVGCTEGVWVGFKDDPKSMQQVLHLKFVTQCAILEDYGIFLVLADKSLFAYHIEALAPSSSLFPPASQQPQKLNGNKDVHFFAVGTLHGRTLVIYMRKKGLDSIFRVLEPVGGKIHERAKVTSEFGSKFFSQSATSGWFKIYKDFFLPSESYDLIFLKERIAIFCSKGFQIMNLNDFQSVTIPQSDGGPLDFVKRYESCRPIGMFKSAEDEFLLCYDEFGVYVDKDGAPTIAGGTIKWEKPVDSVVAHAPYFLLFNSSSIEVRHLKTGRLAQTIHGRDIRCTWDGRSSFSSFLSYELSSDRHVHAVMNAPEAVGGSNSGAIVQQVVQLLPTDTPFHSDDVMWSHF